MTDKTVRKKIGKSLRCYCPQCGEPVEIEYQIKNGEYGECPHEDCDAIIVHEITHKVFAVDSRADVPDYPEWSEDDEWLGYQGNQ